MPDKLFSDVDLENLAATGEAITINGRDFKISSIDASAPAAPAPAPAASVTAPAPITDPSDAYLEYVAKQQAAKQAEAAQQVAQTEASAEQARIAEVRTTARAFNAARHGRKIEATPAPATAKDEDPRIAEARIVARNFGAARRNGAQPRADHKILSRG